MSGETSRVTTYLLWIAYEYFYSIQFRLELSLRTLSFVNNHITQIAIDYVHALVPSHIQTPSFDISLSLNAINDIFEADMFVANMFAADMFCGGATVGGVRWAMTISLVDGRVGNSG